MNATIAVIETYTYNNTNGDYHEPRVGYRVHAVRGGRRISTLLDAVNDQAKAEAFAASY